MKYRLINFLICPSCKAYPLELKAFRVEHFKNRVFKLKPCDLYCGYEEKYVKDIGEENLKCSECIKYEIIDGDLRCSKCGEWYPIVNGIVIMHIGDMRPKKVIKEFIEKYRDRIPSELIEKELARY